MPLKDPPEIEILKSFEAPLAEVPDHPAEAPQELPLETLIPLAEEAYRARDA